LFLRAGAKTKAETASKKAREEELAKGGGRDRWGRRCRQLVLGEGRRSDRSVVGENQTRKAFLTGPF
jgi:hypothetical protein